VSRAFKKLGSIFKVDVDSVELTFYKSGDVKEVRINTKRGGEGVGSRQ
jgi:hypothetical protein